MRVLAGVALLLVGIAFAQSQLVIPQTNNLNAVLSLLPQLQVNRTPHEDLEREKTTSCISRASLINWTPSSLNLLETYLRPNCNR